jgi:purine-binding chemotaxis protein CheW
MSAEMSGSLILRAGSRVLALPTSAVFAVFRMVAMAAQLPRSPRHCLGFADVRGLLVPVLDLAARIGLSRTRTAEELVDGHLILARDPLCTLGWAVDEVRELIEEAPDFVDAPPRAIGPVSALIRGAVRTSTGERVPLLEPAALLTVGARHQLRLALEAHEGL